jgi:hypothetical protein
MARVRYTANRGFDREMANDAEFRRGCLEAAQAIAQGATAIAPRGFMGTRRAYDARMDGDIAVVTAGPGWHLIEFGTVNTGPHGTLRKAVSAVGLTLEPRR